MKWLRLELIAFGPFTNQVLDFSSQPGGVHLVYGANEAGKSSSLRALRYFLYGFPRNVGDDQVHVARQLRIGGQLLDADGQTHHWIRRRGGKGSLRQSDDRHHANPADLDRLLAGIDEDEFQLRFGLHYEELVQGGNAIASGEGELGELLFAAASGLADLGKIQQQLESESAALFRPKGRTLAINQTLEEIAQARKRVQESALATDTWQKCQLELAQVTCRRDECVLKLRELTAEVRLRENQRQALKQLPKRSAWLSRVEELKDVPTLDEDWSRRRQEAEQETLKIQQQLEQLEGWLQDVQRQIDDIRLEPAESEALRRVQAVAEQRSALAQTRRRALDAGKNQSILGESIDQQLAELGRQLETDDYSDWPTLTHELQHRLASLVENYQQLAAQRSTAQEALDEAQQHLRQLQRKMDASEEPPADEPLAERIELAQDEGDLDQHLLLADESSEELQQKIAHAWQRLGRWSGDTASLVTQAWPHRSRLEEYEQQWERMRQTELDLARQLETGQAEVASLHAELAELSREADLPEISELSDLRQQRDQLWKSELQPSLRDPTSLADIQAVWMVHGRAYEELEAQIDQLADQLIEASAKLERLRGVKRALQQREGQLAECRHAAQELEQAGEELQQRFRREWPTGLSSLGTPTEMKDWLGGVEQLDQLLEQAETVQRKRTQQQESRLYWIDQLQGALQQGGCEQAADDPQRLKSWLRLARNQLAQWRGRRTEWQQQRGERDRWELVAEQQRERLQRIEADLTQWAGQWKLAIEPLGALPELLPGAALTMVQGLMEVQQDIKQWRKLGQDVRSAEAEEQTAWTGVREFFAAVGESVPAEELVAVLQQIDDRAAADERLRMRHQDLVERRAVLQQQQADLVARQAALDVECRWLCQRARVERLDQLAEAHAAWESRRQAMQQLEEVEHQLRVLAEDTPLESFVAQLQTLSEDDLMWQLEQIHSQREGLETQREAWSQRVGALTEELSRMNGNDRAAQAQEEVESRIAHLEQQVDAYCQLAFAAQVLNRTIQAYRDKHQGPILEHASRFFATLTCRSYVGLTTDLDDKGQMILLGQRPDGRQVLIHHMSEGTRDQLYLALRLASLKDHLSQHPPWPFIVDDILIKFDDERSLATLEVLAEIGQQTQVILFTHHAHLIELARRELPKNSFQVHWLTEQAVETDAGTPR